MNKSKKYDEPVDVRDAGLGEKYLTLVSDRQYWTGVKAQAEQEIKDRNATIMELQATSGFKTVVTPDWRVTLVQGVNRTISKEKLLELGVKASVIKRATKETTYETVTITANK